VYTTAPAAHRGDLVALLPHGGCRYRGWLGRGNLRANGHPNGGPGRHFQGTACEGYFPEHHGTIFHGKQVAPNTMLPWLEEAAE
jgi:hypothetical protein